MSLRSRLRAPAAAALVGALVAGLLAYPAVSPSEADPGTPRASADGTTGSKDGLTQSRAVFPRASYLCYGYKDCTAKGYSPAGYAAANKTMYWRMYAGHNCTNYAAYRMVRSGLPNTRPWSGGGNATYWGTKMSRITDGTPAVGAVAWWKANAGPAGSAGHVAYVERVVSSTQIVVSQDSWGGDFSWAVITKASGNWPSGFIHFNDLAITNTAVPTVSGLAKVGGTLTATPGTWSPSSAKVAYQWYAGGAAISGATSSSLSLTPALLGKTVTVRTTASLAGYPGKTATSRATAAVLPGALALKARPVVTGTAQVDRTLSVDTGKWNVAPSTYARQWYVDGVPISGATGTTLTITPDLAGREVAASVTASRPGYQALRKASARIGPVAPGRVLVSRRPRITGVSHVGQVLTADLGAYYPADARRTVQWTRDGVAIPGATLPTYRVTAADLGRRLHARVNIRRSGYSAAAAGSDLTAPVRAVPVIRLTKVRNRHNVVLRVEVSSGGLVRPVTGSVLVRVQGGYRVVLELRNGRARVVLPDGQLKRGVHALRVRYAGSTALVGVMRESRLRTY